jgi:hypothetical protein
MIRPRWLAFVFAALSISPGGAADAHRTQIIIEEAAISAWDDKMTVGAQLLLRNLGDRAAQHLRVTAVEFGGGRYQGPAMLPASLGDLAAGKGIQFDAVLNVAAGTGPRVLVVEGDYRLGSERRAFRAARTISPNLTPPGSISGVPAQTTKQNPSNAAPLGPFAAPIGPNSQDPIFVPVGPPRQLFPPTSTGTAIGHQ